MGDSQLEEKDKAGFKALSNGDQAVEKKDAFSLGFLKLVVQETRLRMSRIKYKGGV